MSGTALVTGAASGIGAAVTDRLLRDGWRVAACDVSRAGMGEAAQRRRWPQERAQLHELDVREALRWNEVTADTVRRWGGVDLCVNVAGVLRPGSVGALDTDDVDWMVDVNLKGTIHGTEAAAREMRRAGHGHIVNVCSLAGLSPTPGLALYGASKWGVRGFSLAAALELRRFGIAVTTVCPDAVQTPMLDLQKDQPEAALTFSGRRSLSVDEVAAVICGPVLESRPLEISIPRSRGFLARLAGTLPRLGVAVEPGMRRIGRRNQRRAAQP